MADQIIQQSQPENAPPATPEQAIQNWQAQSNNLSYIVPEVADKLNETGALLYQAQEAARARGDMAAVDQIGVAYANMERMANQVVQLDGAQQAAAEVIRVIEEDRQKVLGEKADFETGVFELQEDGETEHPLLATLAEDLKEHWENVGFHTNCPGCDAMDNGWYDTIDHDDVNDLFRALMSPYFADKVPTEMRESLGQFLRPWVKLWNVHLNELERREKEFQAKVLDEDEEIE